MKSSPAIVADIGGTNARFATWIDGKLEKRWQRPCDGLTGLAEAVQLYLDQADMTSRPQRIALAVAGPADADKVIMTSRTWSISAADLKALGFSDVLLANDFAALAHALPGLGPSQIRLIGDEGAPATGAPLVVVGPGTGLGVAVYTRQDDGGLALQTQGGHVGFAPQDDVEATLLSILRRSLGRVSTEHILSGAGLVRLHHALAQMDGRQVSETSAAAIGEGAAIDAACRATIERFLAILAAFCGDMAMAYGARGGVFIGGGMTPRLSAFLDAETFRRGFEAKGDMAFYTRPIPIWLITGPDAALYGVARMLDAR